MFLAVCCGIRKYMAFFSVIIPIYNADKYLDKCLLSIINQSFSDFELVLVDDGSTDESFSVYSEYQKKDKRIIIVKKEKNEGLVCARDSGLEICSGEYVCWVDADDYIDLDRLQRIYERKWKSKSTERQLSSKRSN